MFEFHIRPSHGDDMGRRLSWPLIQTCGQFLYMAYLALRRGRDLRLRNKAKAMAWPCWKISGMNVGVNEWKSELINEWINEWMNERLNESRYVMAWEVTVVNKDTEISRFQEMHEFNVCVTYRSTDRPTDRPTNKPKDRPLKDGRRPTQNNEASKRVRVWSEFHA